MWFKYGLKAQKLQKQHALKGQKAQKLQKQHALKGQKLLAQGIALGMMAINKAPCKGVWGKTCESSVKQVFTFYLYKY